MQITMFKGLCPVNVPDSWVSDPEKIKFAKLGQSQAIDFRANGGKAFKFWVYDSEPRYQELTISLETIAWGDIPFAVESRKNVAMFGQSSKVIDLRSYDRS